MGTKVRIIFFVLQEFRLKKHVYLEVKMIPTLGLTCSQRGTKAVPTVGTCIKTVALLQSNGKNHLLNISFKISSSILVGMFWALQ